jgi:hypothetical protein
VLPDASTGQSRVLGISQKTVTVQACLSAQSDMEGMAQVLPSRYKAGRVLRMSRYKVDANDILVTGYKFNALQWSGPGIFPVTRLSCVQKQVAKLVTSLLILLTVLSVGFWSFFIFSYFFFNGWHQRARAFCDPPHVFVRRLHCSTFHRVFNFLNALSS